LGLAIEVRGDGDERGQPGDREVLREQVRMQDIIVARLPGDVVQAAVGVLVEAPDGLEVELVAVVVAIAEEADAELVVLEQEAPEIELERLNADANRIEIEAIRAVAQMLVDEQFLHAQKRVGTM